ncbi:T9SS type A sorting domain-containing protein [Niastella caeni]|uniref:T9SS type A sorting domain-containing protein n=1 Tax=Niastella caeni TaxID=2569763 RepID=A0A4V4GZF7_9BACT|nr:T9SS type A sorting domain-containing protein [Niastella caeni]THU32516.1 T9SS type A sorting domain-containing protein [Niastella caeni]
MLKHYLSFTSRYIFTLLLLLITHLLSAQIITTVAGGSIGDGKPATTIGIVSNNGVVTDMADNLYILDNINRRVRKVSVATGIISTIAGDGNFVINGDGGLALNAGLGIPNAMGIDLLGNIYLTSSGRIRKIDAATGIITTIAGTGQGGFSGDSGLAINARVQSPSSITIDTAGNIYFTDFQRVRKITAATGIINTICGNGTAGYTGDGGLAINAQLAGPKSITCDDAGNLYIADNNNNVIRKITAATGIITTYAGTGVSGSGGDGGPATLAQLAYSYAIAADAAGNLYLSDNNKIRMVKAATGIITTVAGNGAGYTGDGGHALLATFLNPRYLTVSRAGNLYIHDFNNYVIRKVTGATNIINTYCGNHTVGTSGIGGPVADAQLYQFNSITVDKLNNIYLTDNSNHKVYRIDAANGFINTVAGTGNQGLNHGNGGPATSANIISPTGVATDSTGNFYFLDNGIAVRKVNIATGIISTVAGNGVQYGYSGDGGPATSAKINRANGLAFDLAGNLFISDRDNNVIRKVSAATGIITTVAGTGTAGYSGDGGLATSATLNKPFGVTVDHSGNIYISDNTNNVIRRVDAITGIITTFAGTGTGGYSGDGGLATAARIRYPYGLTTDTAGNVILADQFNSRVRKITIATGIITTIAGTGTTLYNGDSIPATTANVSNPTAVCFDEAGNLYIGESANSRIRKIIYDTVPADTIPALRLITNNPASTITTNIIKTKVYPNPARESVSVLLTGNFNGKTIITLTDMWGKAIITQQKTIQQNGAFTTTMPLNQLPKGIYFVTIFANQAKQVHKLVIQ